MSQRGNLAGRILLMSVFSIPCSVYLCSILVHPRPQLPVGLPSGATGAIGAALFRTIFRTISDVAMRKSHVDRSLRAHRCTATSFGPYSDGPWWSVFRRSAAYWTSKSFWTTTTDPCITHGPQQDVLGTLRPTHQRFLGQRGLGVAQVSRRDRRGAISIRRTCRAHPPSWGALEV